jgi:hypothetical protein
MHQHCVAECLLEEACSFGGAPKLRPDGIMIIILGNVIEYKTLQSNYMI